MLLMVLLACSAGWAEEAPLALSLELDRKTVKLGEPIELSFALKNQSKKTFLVADPATTPRPTVPPDAWGVILKVVGPDGKTTLIERTDELAMMRFVKQENFPRLAPGKALGGKARLGDRHHPLINNYERWVVYRPGRTSISEREMNVLRAVFSKPGRYRLSGTYTNQVDEYWNETEPEKIDAWMGSVTSPEVVLDVER